MHNNLSRPESPLTIIRTVANANLGYGHLMRCLSLAQAIISHDARVWFAMDELEPGAMELVQAAGAQMLALKKPDSIANPGELIEYARNNDCSWLVVDGYGFTTDYINSLSQTAPVLWLDDLQEIQPDCALLLNQNPAARTDDYKPGACQKLLLGLRYALLRPQFRQARQQLIRNTKPLAEKLLITFGGSDPNHLCARVLNCLQTSRNRYDIRVVAGALHPGDGLAEDAAARSPHKVEFRRRVKDMAELMLWADMAICGSGVTGYEMCCLGLPMAVITPVDNQIPVSAGLEKAGLINHLGWREEVDFSSLAEAIDALAANGAERGRLSQAAMAAVDGKGADRVARLMLEMTESGSS